MDIEVQTMNTRLLPRLRLCVAVLRLRLPVFACLAAVLFLGPPSSKGEGLPEPSLVMYGIVSDAQGVRLTNGVLAVTIVRSDGFPPLVVQARLTNINDQFSYALFIPCETEMPGFAVTATDRLRLLSTPVTHDRSTVTYNGAKTLYTVPSLATLQVASRDRGRFERVDFSPNGASAYDTNGLLKAWELQYFGKLGVDPSADPDADGMNNLAEMLAGTDPTSADSRLAFIQVQALVGGGVQVAWSSQPGRAYRLLRSRDLLGGFTPVGGTQPATPPANQYFDTTALGDGPYFYRVNVVGQ